MRAEQRRHGRTSRIQQRQVEPVDAVHQQTKPGAQVPRHHIKQADLPAMGVEQHQLFDTRGGHGLGDVGPQPEDGVGFERECAGKRRVFRAETDGLRGQKQHRLAGRQVRQRGCHNTLDQGGVHVQRQMRAVLLNRGHGQHGNRT